MTLGEYLIEKKLSHGAFAEEIGVNQAQVTRYVNGTRFPRPKRMNDIVRVTNGAVTHRDFYASDDPPPEPSGTAAPPTAVPTKTLGAAA